MLLKEKGHPEITEVIKPMVKAEASDARTVLVTLNGKQTRETIFSIGDAADLLQGLLQRPRLSIPRRSTPPLGSGAYKVGATRRRALHRI